MMIRNFKMRHKVRCKKYVKMIIILIMFDGLICHDCKVLDENKRHHKEVENNLNNQHNTNLNVSKKNTIECPFCSSDIKKNAIVCHACGASIEETEVPGTPFKWRRFFVSSSILFFITHSVILYDSGISFYAETHIMDIIIPSFIMSCSIPYYFSRRKKSTVTRDWVR